MSDLSHSPDQQLRPAVKIGWAAGGVGSTTMLYLVNAMLMFFMVAKLGIQPAVAGAMLLAVRLYDGVLDLAVGALSDRTRTRWGRRRPWMAAGTALSILGTVAIFLPPAADGAIGRHAQVVAAILLFFTGYSCFSVPSSAMPAEMTRSYEERTSLMAWRTFFLQVAGLVGGAGAPWLVALLGSGRDAYLQMALAAAAIVGASMAVAVVSTQGIDESTVPAAPRAATSRRAALRSLAGNRPFVVLVAVKFCGYVAIAAMGAVGLFFVRDVLARDEAVMAQIQLVSALAGIATLPLWRAAARGRRKEHVYVAALILNIVAGASWLLAGPGEPGWIMVLRAALLGVGASGGLLMALAMLPDAIAYDVRRTGLRREGAFAGIFEFFQKCAYAVAPFVVGVFLQLNGYVAGQDQAVQNPAAIAAVRLTMGLLPVIAYGLALVLLLTLFRLPEDMEAR